jgi:hypothetical protein
MCKIYEKWYQKDFRHATAAIEQFKWTSMIMKRGDGWFYDKYLIEIKNKSREQCY